MGIHFKLFVIGYLRDQRVNYPTLMASFGMFPTAFKTYEKRYKRFRSTEVLSDILYRYD